MRQCNRTISAVGAEQLVVPRVVDAGGTWFGRLQIGHSAERGSFPAGYQGLFGAGVLLSLHPGPDIAAPAAAALVDMPVDRARPLLDQLTGAHLAAEHAPGQILMHDLLRSYATELTEAHDTAAHRRAAQPATGSALADSVIAGASPATPRRWPAQPLGGLIKRADRSCR
jgi:hypothetical protein